MSPLIKLNPEQNEAVKYREGPLLIIAGAGTGKTTVITERIKYLILEKKVLPSKILALTFTEKAAMEMEERIDLAMPYGYTQLWISTFHSFSDRILRNDAIHIGLNPAYKLLSEAESVLFLQKNLFKFNLEYFRPLGNPNKFLQGILQHFNRLKDEDVSPSDYLMWAQKQKATNIDADEIRKNLELADAYKRFEELKVKEGVMDFSDLISYNLKLFRERNNILLSYQNQFEYILIDEFQDTNYAQNEMAILLAGKNKNITVVGDDDQAIYRWRGAALSNMIQFKKHFPDAKIITLTKNYRSTKEILDKSYQLIQNNNPDRLEAKENINKQLESVRKIKGEEIEFLFSEKVENEAELVAKRIQELIEAKKISYKDIAILVRANDHASPFTRALSRYNIPYQFLGPGQLFKQEEIKDLIAYLKVLYNFEDSVSLYRVLNISVFNFEPFEIASLLNMARKKNLSLFEALEKALDEIIFKDKTKEKIKKIYEMVNNHLKRVPKDTAGQILFYFLKDSGILKNLIEIKSEGDEKKSQNIAKFFDKLKTYEVDHEDASVFAVIDWIELSMQMGESPLAANIDWSQNNAVNILTIHSSKGLEFPIVFLINLVTNRFPTRERKEQIPIPQDLIKEILPSGDFHIQEERRLFYVGLTRARDKLFLTASNFYGEGKRERKISPFVYETVGENIVNQTTKKQTASETVKQLLLFEKAEQLDEKQENRAYKLYTPINYLSYSQIQTFEICPLHYKLKYLLKIPTETSAAQSFGISIHNVLRNFYSKIIKNEKLNISDSFNILKEVWVSEGYKSKDHELKALEKAKNILTNYLDKNLRDKYEIIALEYPFNFFLNQQRKRLKVGGRIDRINKINEREIEILDYKTGNNVPTEKELAKDKQLTFYALAATKEYELLRNKKPEEILLSLYYLEEGKKLTTRRTQEELKEAEEYILEKAKEIEESDFSCSKSSFCKICEYKMLCSTNS